MPVQVKEVIAKTILTPQKLGNLAEAFDYSLNPYAGCAFGCSYCYVPKFPNREHQYLEWGSWVNAKVNAPELITKERAKVYASRIFFSSATDPYQYAELKYGLSRKCLERLIWYQPKKITLHTRSHLVLRDLDLLKSYGARLEVGVSITTDNEFVRRQFEPNAPSLRRRLELIRALRQAGISVYASIAPLLPSDPDRLAALLSDYVSQVWIDRMRWQEINTRPDLLEKYADFFDPGNYQYVQEKIARAFRQGRTEGQDGDMARASAGDSLCLSGEIKQAVLL